MCEIKEVCVENMKKIRENFIENYPFVYVDDAIKRVARSFNMLKEMLG